ncbi:MAG: DUF542 domain-containing protein [Chitinophagaceae bacterium]
MLVEKLNIEKHTTVNEIVRKNHHTAEVFRKYNIEYCCGGKWPLEAVCLSNGIAFEQLKQELQQAMRVAQLPANTAFETWDTDFLTKYIVNVYHQHIKRSLPVTGDIVQHFADGHVKKFPEMQEVASLFHAFEKEILPHIQYEEETIFPYISQLSHAHQNNDSYAKLLVKTLRKRLDLIMKQEEDFLSTFIVKIRLLTNNYHIPVNACVSHRLALLRLNDLDNDLVQHIYLENEILYPRALKIEQELLEGSI